ncbi:MAG: hypothetical protein JXN65_11925 [Clostridia bacterium]|nr:hypothetical protein [Clostridia bacterium]
MTESQNDSMLALSDKLYNNLGIKKNNVETWEDGIRTTGKKGTYEWWYTDTEFEDGTTIVVVFYTKFGFDIQGPSRPTVSIDITYPNGTKLSKTASEEKNKLIDASKEKCDVKVKHSYLKYINGDYELLYNEDGIEFKAKMTSRLPMWRPETGHMYFGKKNKDYFAWLPAQPSCTIKGELKIDGQVKNLSGIGYHDHNWGNIPMNKVMNHWYWCRANIGGYTIIASDIISEKKYGYKRTPIFMLGKDGRIFDLDLTKTVIMRDDTKEHEVTGKFIDNHLTFVQHYEGVEYKIEFIREKDIVAVHMLDMLPKFKKAIAKLLGLNPTYLRILGTVRLTITKNGKEEILEHEGLWEQMFFGNNKHAIIN